MKERTIQNPRSIEEYYGDYMVSEEPVSNHIMMSIIHMLPVELQHSFLQKYGAETGPKWARHMEGRRTIYEPMVESLTTFRPDIVDRLNLQPGDTLIDFGGGLAPVAAHIDTSGVHYIDIDARAPKDIVENLVLNPLVASEKLASATFFSQDVVKGLPEGFPSKTGRRIGLHVFSTSYLPADAMLNVVEAGFNDAGCDKQLLVALDPNGFDPVKMLDEMLEYAYTLPLERQQELAPIIAQAKPGSAGRKFMEDFSYDLLENMPIRTPEETEFYLKQVAEITDKSVFGQGTGGSVGFMMVPRSA